MTPDVERRLQLSLPNLHHEKQSALVISLALITDSVCAVYVLVIEHMNGCIPVCLQIYSKCRLSRPTANSISGHVTIATCNTDPIRSQYVRCFIFGLFLSTWAWLSLLHLDIYRFLPDLLFFDHYVNARTLADLELLCLLCILHFNTEDKSHID